MSPPCIAPRYQAKPCAIQWNEPGFTIYVIRRSVAEFTSFEKRVNNLKSFWGNVYKSVQIYGVFRKVKT